MTKFQDISTANIGLRAYDSALGFRNLEERSGAMADFGPTHTIGMMAVLSNAIRGQDVIKDARMLKVIAAEVLKINLYAFDCSSCPFCGKIVVLPERERGKRDHPSRKRATRSWKREKRRNRLPPT